MNVFPNSVSIKRKRIIVIVKKTEKRFEELLIFFNNLKIK